MAITYFSVCSGDELLGGLVETRLYEWQRFVAKNWI